MRFADATAVARSGPDRWSAHVQPDWDIGGIANGGYLLALAARAMSEAAARPDPVTITAHFLSPGKAGPVEIATEIVKEGRRFATVSATLASDRPVLRLLGAFGDLSGGEGPDRVDAEPPTLPDPHECVRFGSGGAPGPSMMSQIELRLHPDDARFHTAPSGEPRVRGWFRLRDDEPIDGLSLLFAADAFPPTAFNANLPVGWTPTVEMTAHVRARPTQGWLRCEFTTRFFTGGFLEEDGVIWDDRGRLVAQSRQLALIPRG